MTDTAHCPFCKKPLIKRTARVGFMSVDSYVCSDAACLSERADYAFKPGTVVPSSNPDYFPDITLS